MILKQFDLPAFLNDFPDDPRKAKELAEAWNKNVNRWTEAAILGDPWTVLNDRDRSYYYNPLTTELPPGVTLTDAPIPWTAFPNRILHFFPNASKREQWKFADEGPPNVGGNPYTPEGPRGWQDEYCEWSVTRGDDGKITKVMFTCENAEYWFTLWNVSPERVLALYQELVSPEVKIEDLYLTNGQKVVIDPSTGRPAYNALNKWNSTTTGGAVHLVSPPNTLGAEIYLAAAATLLRAHGNVPVTGKDELLDCSRYGQAFRNSDPFIGWNVNTLVRKSGDRVTLKNPVGLYIQQPHFGQFLLPDNAPDGAKPADYWRIVRGQPGMGLHAVFEVPSGLGFTVGDITINGDPIEYGSQITQTFQMQLTGQGIPSTQPPKATECQEPNPAHLPAPQVLQFPALGNANSRSTLAPQVAQGSAVSLTLTGGNIKKGATVTFLGEGVTAHGTDSWTQIDKDTASMVIRVEVAASAPLGDRALLLTNPDGAHGPAAPGMLEVVPAGSIPVSAAQVLEVALPGDAKSWSEAAPLKPAALAYKR